MGSILIWSDTICDVAEHESGEHNGDQGKHVPVSVWDIIVTTVIENKYAHCEIHHFTRHWNMPQRFLANRDCELWVSLNSFLELCVSF